MAEFSGRIVDVVYADSDYSLISVKFEDDTGALCVYNLLADPDSQDYKDLEAEGWDDERIIDSTVELKKAQAAAFNIEVNTAARALAEEMIGSKEFKDEMQRDARSLINSSGGDLYVHIFDNNDNKDELFKFKLWALEQEAVKAASKEQKSAIRKAKTITSGISLVDAIINP